VYTRSTVDFLDEDFDVEELVSGAGLPVRVNWRVARFAFASVSTAGIFQKPEGKGKGLVDFLTIFQPQFSLNKSKHLLCGPGSVQPHVRVNDSLRMRCPQQLIWPEGQELVIVAFQLPSSRNDQEIVKVTSLSRDCPTTYIYKIMQSGSEFRV